MIQYYKDYSIINMYFCTYFDTSGPLFARLSFSSLNIPLLYFSDGYDAYVHILPNIANFKKLR